MTYRKCSSVVLVVFAFAAMSVGGCMGVGGCSGDATTSGLLKVATGQMTQLTTDEFKALAHAAAAQQGATLPEIPDSLAQAALDILNANGVNTIDQLMALVEKLQQNPGSVVIPQSAADALPALIQLLADFGAQGVPST